MKIQPKKDSGMLSLIPFALVLLAFATAIADETSEEPQEAEVLTSLEQRMLKEISVDFRDMPIDDFIRIIAEQADVDIIKSPTSCQRKKSRRSSTSMSTGRCV